MEQNKDNRERNHDDLLYKLLEIDGELEMVFAHKQINDTEHYVITHGEKKDSKLKFFKLISVGENQFDIFQYISPKLIAEVSRVIMGEIDAADSKLLANKS